MSESTADLRRERDAIRVEMERVVRQMQSLEADPCVDLVLLDFAMPGMNGAEAA